MKSTVVSTREIDNLEVAVKELVSKVKEKLTLARNSIGVVYCDADVEVDKLGKLISVDMGIDVVGLTTTATIERTEGYNDMGIVLCVMTADNVEFSVGCTGDLNKGNFPEVIKEAYKKARVSVQKDPKLILTFAPYIADLTSETYVELLDEASGGVPIFGGVATDHYDLQYQKTFYNGQAFDKGLVFILISGDVKPVFSMKHNFGTPIAKKGIITKSSGNFIEMVGNQTFKDFVSSMVPVPDEELVIYHFQSTPFVMELPDFEKDEQSVVRVLVTVDHEKGSGSFLSKMPEGSTIYLNEFQRENLSKSCKETLLDVSNKISENSDYEYSMIFVSTCNARHLLMADDKSLESNILSEYLSNLPPQLNAIGFYCFGEICPTGKREDGTAKNRFHNISFAVCAI